MEEYPELSLERLKESEETRMKNARKLYFHLVNVSKRMGMQHEAHKVLDIQLNRTKNAAMTRAHKDVLEQEFSRLKKQFDNVLETEGKIIRMQEHDESMQKEILKKVARLEKVHQEVSAKADEGTQRRIDRLAQTVNALQDRLSHFVDEKKQHDERVHELEQKIQKKIDEKQQHVHDVEDALRQLNEKYKSLKAKGSDANALKKIKARISGMRTQINGLKSKRAR